MQTNYASYWLHYQAICLHLLIKDGRNNYFTISIQTLQLQIHPSTTLGSRNKPWTQLLAFYHLTKLIVGKQLPINISSAHTERHYYVSVRYSLSFELCSAIHQHLSLFVYRSFKGSEPFPIKLQTIKRWIKVEVEAISHCIPRLCRARSHRCYSLICLEAVTCHRTPMAAVR